MKSRFTISRILPLICIAFLLSFSTFAQQSKKISLQGFLKDANGKAVENNPNYEIIFKLYTTPTGGTAAWTEPQILPVSGGVYSTQLGKTVSLENLNWGASTYYVGVTIQGTELSPRTELTFAPYSLGSPKAQEVVCSGAVGDVKYSILNPTQFALQNGSCWVPMDGRGLATTDKLRQITGMGAVPNAGGLFLRSQPSQNGGTNYDPERNSGTPIASVQNASFAAHGHSATLGFAANTSYQPDHSHSSSIPGRGEGGGTLPTVQTFASFSATNEAWTFQHGVNSTPAGGHFHTISGSASGSTENTGGSETRPVNLNLWTYIRIN